MRDEGVRRSAIVLVALGEEAAAAVLKHLRPREISKLSAAMAEVDAVPRDQLAETLQELHRTAERQRTFTAGGDAYVRSVLNRALGSEKAAPVIDRVLPGSKRAGIDELQWMDAAAVADLIRDEDPQIIATLLLYLEPDQASEVLCALGHDLRGETILRVAHLEGVQPNALEDLNAALQQILVATPALDRPSRVGVDAAVAILDHMRGEEEIAVAAYLRDHDPDVAARIEEGLLTFDDLLRLDDAGLRTVLRGVTSETLVTALKGASAAVTGRALQVLPREVADALRDELDASGPVRLARVEAAQRQLLRSVRRLAAMGRIELLAKGELIA